MTLHIEMIVTTTQEYIKKHEDYQVALHIPKYGIEIQTLIWRFMVKAMSSH